jgi:GntR family transcriptional repressor for pyruvate dehydrogenase complex
MFEQLDRADSLVERVVHALLQEIEQGKFPPNTRLPAEQLLAQQLNVSRPVIREAIARLKVDNILVTRKGSGAYVSANPVGNAYRLDPGGRDGVNLQHVFELRYWAECAAAELAARRRTDSDIQAIEAALVEMDRTHGDFVASGMADIGFHRAIAVATRNAYFSGFVDFLGRQLLETRRLAWENSARLWGGSSPAQQEHRLIFEAISSGDPDAARNAARNHLIASARRLRMPEPVGTQLGSIYPTGGKE